jgi:capsular polysaccharide biosynthesis protein
LLMKSFQESFDLRKIKLPELRDDVKSALEYQRRIDAYVWDQDDSLLWDRAQDTANQIQTWIKNVYQLACHLDTYYRDTLIHEELAEIPQEVAALEHQQRQGIEANLIDDFTQLLESKRNHLETLKTLDAKMKQAALQLDHSISSLATVDSQIRLIAAQDVDNSRSERLRADIHEQVSRLNDLIASIEEVYDL